jgi:hypothetical protein
MTTPSASARPRPEHDHQVEGRTGNAVKEGGQRIEGQVPLMSAPSIRRTRIGAFWAEIIVGGIAAILFVVTPFRRDWIEAISGFDPDQRGGSVEWIVVVALLFASLALLGAFPWIKDRGRGRRSSEPGGS